MLYSIFEAKYGGFVIILHDNLNYFLPTNPSFGTNKVVKNKLKMRQFHFFQVISSISLLAIKDTIGRETALPAKLYNLLIERRSGI